MNNPSDYLTDYHRQRNKAVVEAVEDSLKHPVSLKEAREQVEHIRQQSQSTEKKGQPSVKE